MKIVLLTFSYKKTGGIEKVAKDIYYSLKSTHDIHIISIDEVSHKFENTILNKIYKKFFLRRDINKKIDLYSPDLIVSLHPFLLDFLNVEKVGKKLICWVHGIDVFGANGLKAKHNLEQCKRVIAVSNFTKKHLVEDLDYNNKIDVINNCVNLNTFRYYENKIEDSTFQLLTVGRLSSSEKYKGHDLVIRALAKLVKVNKNICYTIVGDGDDTGRLKSLARDYLVEEFVRFKGKVSFEEIINEYKRCNVFVMPSFFEKKSDGTYTGEGFGIVYIEAGATGRPVIGCRIGGQADCIIDDYNGKLVKPTVEDVAEKILYFVKDKERMVEMGNNNRKLVEERFSFEIFKKSVSSLIESL